MKRKRSSMEPLGEVQIELLATSEKQKQASPSHLESQKELFPGPPGSPLSGKTFLELFSTTIDPPSPQLMKPEAVGEAELLSPSKNQIEASPPLVEDSLEELACKCAEQKTRPLWPIRSRKIAAGLAVGWLVEPYFGKTLDEALSIAKIIEAEAFDKATAASACGLSPRSTFNFYHDEIIGQIHDKYAPVLQEWDFDQNKPKTLPGQGSTSSQQQRDSGMSLLEYFQSPETQALLSDKDKLSQLVEQHPKLMELFKALLSDKDKLSQLVEQYPKLMELFQALLSDKDVLSQLVGQNPKLMEMFQEKLEQQRNGSSHVSSMVECNN